MNSNVLIIEDEHDIANLIKFRLEEQGYDTTVANTGVEAIQEIGRSKPDLITLDLNLPDLSGYSILKELKSNPNTNMIPVFVISSSTAEKRALKMGAEKFVVKPINFPILFKILEKVNSRKKTAKQVDGSHFQKSQSERFNPVHYPSLDDGGKINKAG